MYRILHVSADYLLCSLGFEYIKTGEHVLVGYFDDSLHDLLSLFKLQFDHELAGKVIFLS